jgi:uncharacterized protein YjbI with pentapeptide repeats
VHGHFDLPTPRDADACSVEDHLKKVPPGPEDAVEALRALCEIDQDARPLAATATNERSMRHDLRGANLRKADLSGLNLCSCDLRKAYLEGVFLKGADLRRADLWEARLEGANLTARCKLAYADLRNAHLQETDLPSAIFDRAVLGGAELDFAVLSGSDLTNTIGVGSCR